MSNNEQEYLIQAKAHYQEWWHDKQAWSPTSARPGAFGSAAIHLDSHIIEDGAQMWLPRDRLGVIPSREVWQRIEQDIARFYAAYTEEDIDAANWRTLADRERSARSFGTSIRPGYVYLVNAGDLYKIGATKNLEQRIPQLVAPNGEKISLVTSIPSKDIFGLEARLHARYEKKRISGEWFTLDQSDLEDFMGIRKLAVSGALEPA